jgi:hypothetical protein
MKIESIRRKHKKTTISFAAMILTAMGMISCSGRKSEPLPPTDPDRALIEAWLKENLDAPQWEPVKWWPAVDQGPIYDDLLRQHQAWRKAHPGPFEAIGNDDLPDDDDLAKFVLTDESNQQRPPFPEKVIRFKFRTKVAGSLALQDMVFVIQDGRVRKIDAADMVFSRTLQQLDTSHTILSQ